jgi:pilus assembly protein CpaB
MRPNSILILLVAIVMGGIAAFLARNWLISRTQATATTTTVIAAAKQLPFGTPLTDDAVIEMPWAAKTVPEGSFSSKQALFKDGRRITLATIQQNEPILNSKITGPGQRASLSTLLDSDKRAITIRVDDVRGVAGFVLPNDRVDVVLIRAASDSGHRQSDLLLQDIKVIAVDQIAAEQKNQPVVARAVTLEVTPFQAQKISLATSVGNLSLILRKAGDSNVVADRRVTESDLTEGEARPAPPQAPAKAQPPPVPVYSGATVTIIRNLKGQEYKVDREIPHSADRGTTTAR